VYSRLAPGSIVCKVRFMMFRNVKHGLASSLRTLSNNMSLLLDPHAKVLHQDDGADWSWLQLLPATWQAAVQGKLARQGELGLVGSIKRMLSVARHPVQHLQWLAVMRGDASQRVVTAYPRILFRYTLPYLASSIGRTERLSILKTHYGFVNAKLGKAFFDHVLDDRLCVWRHRVDGHELSVHMTGPCMVTVHREGELTLNFRLDGQTLCRLAFSVAPAHAFASCLSGSQAVSPLVLYVGQVQGSSGTFEAIRQATKLCSDIAPHDMLMAALVGLSQAWGVSHALGVHTDQHICADKFAREGGGFDYNGFWDRYGAQRTAQGHHLMNLPFADKPLSLIAAKHRGRTRVKRALKQALATEVMQTLEHRLWPC
jgi:uncharacterized protein